MEYAARSPGRATIVAPAMVVAALVVLALSILTSLPLREVVPVTAAIAIWAVTYRFLLTWRNLLALLILVILAIPIRRYALPGSLPFQLEPYRLLVILVVGGWAASLLVDRRVRVRSTGFEKPIALVAAGIIGSELANPGRVASVSSYSVKQLTFFASFLLVLYVIASVVRSQSTVDFLLRTLVGGGAVVAALTIVEARTGFNVFDHLSKVIPLLREQAVVAVGQDGRGDRAFASAQHPIALGAALALLLPPALYLAQSTRRRRWLLAAALLLLGSVATYSRTSVLMLVGILVVFFWLRRAETKRFWPALVPAVLAMHLLVPGALGTVKNAFLPQGGLVAQQQAGAGTAGSGRLADLGPGLREWSARPIFGEGFGTRVVNGPDANAPILDDQWLGTLLETGIVGFLGWLWLIGMAVRRLGRRAKLDRSPRGWLAVALAASIAGYGASMATYDSFAFIQVTFILFFLLGFAAVLLRSEPSPA